MNLATILKDNVIPSEYIRFSKILLPNKTAGCILSTYK